MNDPGATTTEILKGLTGFRQAEVLWRDLLERSAAAKFPNDFDWLCAHAGAFGVSDRLRTYVVRDGGNEPIGAFALAPELDRGSLLLPRLRPIGDGSFDSDDLEPLAVRGREPQVARAFCDVIGRLRRPSAVVMSSVDERSPMLRALLAELNRRQIAPRVHPGEAGVASLGADLGATVAGLASRMRSKVRQALRRSEAAGAEFDRCERPEQLADFTKQLVHLHTLRWQALGEPGAFGDPRRVAFYESLLPPFLAREQLVLTRLSIAGEPVALQLGFRSGDLYIQLQEGYDPRFEDQRVGVALRAHSIEWLTANGVRTYDFLAGLTRHKLDWGALARPSPTLAIPTGNPVGRLRFAALRWREKRRPSSEGSESNRNSAS